GELVEEPPDLLVLVRIPAGEELAQPLAAGGDQAVERGGAGVGEVERAAVAHEPPVAEPAHRPVEAVRVDVELRRELALRDRRPLAQPAERPQLRRAEVEPGAPGEPL